MVSSAFGLLPCQINNESVHVWRTYMRTLQRMRRIFGSSVLGFALLLSGCGSSEDDSVAENSEIPVSATTIPLQSSSSDASSSDFAEVSSESGKPSITIAANATEPSDLVIKDVVPGSGAVVGVGDLIEVKYVGVLLEDGAEFDASWDRGQTFFVPVGVGAVIPGWDQGLLGMREGGRRLLIIPPNLGYGAAGAGSAVPANATLLFAVDLVQIVNVSVPAIPSVNTVGTDLEVEDLLVGDGEAVEPGDTVSVHYLGSLVDGTVFDTSWSRGRPFTTQIGVGMVIQGWDQGIIGMREGGRRLLKVPSDLAYGETGAGSSIGPDTPLVFVVDLLRIQG